jgi:WD40 repeat protein
VLDEELQTLPERYREPLLLCYFEGRTRDQAAGHLGWSLRTLDRRLARGKELLRVRLEGRGLALPGLLLAAGLSQGTASPVLTAATVRAAGTATPADVSPRVLALALAQGGSHLLAAGKARCLLALFLTVGVLAAGGVLTHQPAAEGPPPVPGQPRPPTAGESELPDRDDPLPAGAVARLGTRRFRHEGDATSLAFSPDGKVLAAGVSDGAVCLWEAATGKLLRRFDVGAAWQWPGIAFSPDSKRLAVAAGSELSLWDVATGARLFRHLRDVRFRSPCGLPILFSPDGKRLYLPAASGKSLGVAVIDASTGAEIRQIGVTNILIDGLALSPDGATLAVASHRDDLRCQNIRLLDVAADKVVRELRSPRRRKGEDLTVYAAAFSPDGRTLAWGGWEHIYLADAATGKQLGTLATPDQTATQLVFAPDGATLISDGPHSKVHLWDVARRKLRRELDGRMWGGRGLALSRDGKTVAVGSAGSTIRLWELPTGRELGTTFHGHDAPVKALAFARDGRRLLSGDDNGQVRLWDTTAARALRQWRTDGTALAFSHDGKRFATANGTGPRYTGEEIDEAARVWDAVTGKELLRLHPKAGHVVRQMAFAPEDGALIAAVSTVDRGYESSARVYVWDAGTGRRLRDISLGDLRSTGLVLTPDGQTLALSGAYGGDNPVRIRSLSEDGETLKLPEGKHWLPLSFSPDGRLLATRIWGDGPFRHRKDPDRSAYLFEAATGEEVLRLENATGVVAFSPDGRRAATVPDWRGRGPRRAEDSGGVITLWDLPSGVVIRRFPIDHARVYALEFSLDGSRLASGLGDGTVLLWDVAPAARALRPPPEPDAEQQEQMWADLAGTDARKAYAAVWSLAAHPRRAVPLLRERLARAVRPDPARLARLIADLDDEQFAVRERAAGELEKVGEAAEPALRRALRQNPSLEVRRRIEPLLGNLTRPPLSSERLRALRAVTVLEQAGTAEARQLVGELASGDPDVRLAREAKAALRRLAAR